MNDKLVNKFGYSEMYEWTIYPGDTNKLGRFVQFNSIEHDKINLAVDPKTPILGVSTINYVTLSDNPDTWSKKYLSNEYGDIFMTKERLAVGQKQYDQIEEFSYIHTFPYEQYIPVENKEFNKNYNYVKRSERSEWSCIVLLGKAIVKDNGKCKPGEYCKPNFSDINDEAGIAVPATINDENSFYVLKRISDTTIMILIK